jgi:hypothetical protein
MQRFNERYIVLTGLLFIFIQQNFAGPPFFTDDPVPVDYKHWEYYISSVSTFQPGAWTGTSPHFEVNYGLVPNVQVHLLLPMNYDYHKPQDVHFGYASTEFGIKYRFIQETDNTPQIGVFPIIEIPTIKNDEFGNGKAQIFLPVWMQKTWGKFTTYGGAGLWINPGTNNKNWTFTGLEVQYDISSMFTIGGEVYYHSADAINSNSTLAFNLGGFINFTEKFHFIYSIGNSLTNDSFISSYVGLLWTI